MPSNTAAWLVAANTTPLEIKAAPYTSPDEHEIVVKNSAVAINPVDWVSQEGPPFPLEYPAVSGHDIAGEVFEVGSSVTQFAKGDRVLGFSLGSPMSGRQSNKACEGAFQEYTVVRDVLTCKIPNAMSFEQASVIPVGLSTAACGLFAKDFLALPHPSLNPKPTGKTLIVWGGASSVGSNVIQLAAAAGCEVVTTSSPKNFDYVKKLGASQTLDYHSETIAQDLIAALEGKACAGLYEASGAEGVFEICATVLAKSHGERFIASVRPPPEKIPEGISSKFVFSTDLKGNEVGPAIFEKFLPEALVQGKYIAAPDAVVVGNGLEAIQKGYDILKPGVSAKKIVVTL